ncbi:hypothetical protein, partial [Muribaculum intestinale]|uniref:hypothetical protein n=3 Tax=Muribaculum intestinale TaxID=1796646 RepID=UPI0025B6F75D
MKTRLLIKYMMLIIASVAASAQERIERTPAFPGAEGWGRYVTGGRGGKAQVQLASAKLAICLKNSVFGFEKPSFFRGLR